MKDTVGLCGEWDIVIRNVITGAERRLHLHNTLTTIWQEEIIKNLNGSGEPLQIKYIALGTGSTAATPADTKLESEIFRREPTQRNIMSGYYRTALAVLPAEAVANIREIGVFFGSTATSTADTGLLLSRTIVDIDKTSSEEMIFTRKDIISINV